MREFDGGNLVEPVGFTEEKDPTFDLNKDIVVQRYRYDPTKPDGVGELIGTMPAFPDGWIEHGMGALTSKKEDADMGLDWKELWPKAVELFNEGKTTGEAAEILGIQYHQMRDRIKKMKKDEGYIPPWQKEQKASDNVTGAGMVPKPGTAPQTEDPKEDARFAEAFDEKIEKQETEKNGLSFTDDEPIPYEPVVTYVNHHPPVPKTPEGMMSAACHIAMSKVQAVIDDDLALALFRNLREQGVVA